MVKNLFFVFEKHLSLSMLLKNSQPDNIAKIGDVKLNQIPGSCFSKPPSATRPNPVWLKTINSIRMKRTHETPGWIGFVCGWFSIVLDRPDTQKKKLLLCNV
jgi:hypothetical protein